MFGLFLHFFETENQIINRNKQEIYKYPGYNFDNHRIKKKIYIHRIAIKQCSKNRKGQQLPDYYGKGANCDLIGEAL